MHSWPKAVLSFLCWDTNHLTAPALLHAPDQLGRELLGDSPVSTSLFSLGMLGYRCALLHPALSGRFWGLNTGCQFCKDSAHTLQDNLPVLFRLCCSSAVFGLMWPPLSITAILVLLWDSCPKPHCSGQCLRASFTMFSSSNFTDSDLEAFNTISEVLGFKLRISKYLLELYPLIYTPSP